MDKYLYTCDYCAKTYVPKRRYKQRFCSNSCRVNSHKRKNRLSLAKPDVGLKSPAEKPYKEGISMAGIGNAAIANVVTEVGKSIFIKEENKPVTKGDFQKLADKLGQRYILIKNMDARADGAPAYFDTTLQKIVHLKFLPPWK
jgi:hypothetical protein